MVRSLYTYGTPGAISFSDGRLAYVQILGVKRNGIGFEDTFYSGFPDVPPGNAQFQYFAVSGTILFSADVPFAGPPFGRPNAAALEKIFVLYKSPI